MVNINVYDNIDFAQEKIKDAKYLMQEIFEGYFEKYDSKDCNDRTAIAWEYDRYAAFFRVLIDCIDDVTKFMLAAEEACIE